MATSGAVDCDVHVSVPNTAALLPHLDELWCEHVVVRGIDDLELTCNMLNSPYASRPDWRPAKGKPGSDRAMLSERALDAFGSTVAIARCLWGAPAVHAPDLAAALCRGVNDWLAREWLDAEPRLRASIVVPFEYPELAAAEIERRAADRRFVDVLVLAMGEMPLGRRHYWPIYEAAERFGLPVAIHAGSTYRHAPTSIGWPSFFTEDTVAQSGGFQNQLLSLVGEGVFTRFPKLRVVLVESGVTWLPGFMWRADKTWRGLRMEIPWTGRAPSELIREHVRLTIQPFDAPGDAAIVERVIEQIGCDDMLLFATDYPHWHFDGGNAWPSGLPEALRERIMVDNALATYPRLRETLQ